MNSVFVVAAAILLLLLEIQTSASHGLHKYCTTELYHVHTTPSLFILGVMPRQGFMCARQALLYLSYFPGPLWSFQISF